MNMHLHGHLAECIEDFEPVYSFWCFAYERMNGVLGAYHTNTHHISIQYMRRFLDSKSYAPIYWPSEFVDEYLPMTRNCTYQKRSLMQTNLETEIKGLFLPLPQVQEGSLSPDQIQQVRPFFENLLGNSTFRILMLCRHTKTLSVGECILGAKHSKSNLVLAHCSREQNELAEVSNFQESTAITSDSRTVRLWIACVKNGTLSILARYGMRYRCGQRQVLFIPVRSISSRVVHVKCTRSFYK